MFDDWCCKIENLELKTVYNLHFNTNKKIKKTQNCSFKILL